MMTTSMRSSTRSCTRWRHRSRTGSRSRNRVVLGPARADEVVLDQQHAGDSLVYRVPAGGHPAGDVTRTRGQRSAQVAQGLLAAGPEVVLHDLRRSSRQVGRCLAPGGRNATGEPVQVAAEGAEPVDQVGGPTKDQWARVLGAVAPEQVIDCAQEAISLVCRGLLDITAALLRHPDGPGTLERVPGPDQPEPSVGSLVQVGAGGVQEQQDMWRRPMQGGDQGPRGERVLHHGSGRHRHRQPEGPVHRQAHVDRHRPVGGLRRRLAAPGRRACASGGPARGPRAHAAAGPPPRRGRAAVSRRETSSAARVRSASVPRCRGTRR